MVCFLSSSQGAHRKFHKAASSRQFLQLCHFSFLFSTSSYSFSQLPSHFCFQISLQVKNTRPYKFAKPCSVSYCCSVFDTSFKLHFLKYTNFYKLQFPRCKLEMLLNTLKFLQLLFCDLRMVRCTIIPSAHGKSGTKEH